MLARPVVENAMYQINFSHSSRNLNVNYMSSTFIIMHYMVIINDVVCIINHRILRYIQAGENNRKCRKRGTLSFIRFESVEHGDLLHTESER